MNTSRSARYHLPGESDIEQGDVADVYIHRTLDVVQEELTTRPGDSVLLVVDRKKDFMHPDGALAAPDPEPTIDAVTGLIDSVRSAGVPVWYTRDTHREGDPVGDVGPTRGGGHPGLGVHRSDRAPGGGAGVPEVPLRRLLRHRPGPRAPHPGLTQLVICGTVANICVHYTAASAAIRWSDVVHPVEAIQALTEFDRHAALRQASWLFGADLVRADGLHLR